MKPVDVYFLKQKEPYQSIMLYIRQIVIKTIPNIKERYSYNIPFYNIGKKPLMYLNVLKGTNYVDVAFMQGILLESDFPELKDYNNRKQVRSIQVKSLEAFDEFRFVELLKVAVSRLEKSNKA